MKKRKIVIIYVYRDSVRRVLIDDMSVTQTLREIKNRP